MKLIKSISGIRGIVGQNLDTDITNFYSSVFSSIQESGDILIARDSRPHGKKIYDEACKTLASLGRNVISCGIIPTPTAQYIIKEKKLAGGMVITASHNPIEWNGLKFLDYDGCFLSPEKMKLLLSKKLIRSRSRFTNYLSKIYITFPSIIKSYLKDTRRRVRINTNQAFRSLIFNSRYSIIVCNGNGYLLRTRLSSITN